MPLICSYALEPEHYSASLARKGKSSLLIADKRLMMQPRRVLEAGFTRAARHTWLEHAGYGAARRRCESRHGALSGVAQTDGLPGQGHGQRNPRMNRAEVS